MPSQSSAMSDAQVQPTQVGRRELFDRIWSKPMTTNATEFGTSASMLSTLAKRLGLPLPRAGHWMKKEVGREPPTPEYPADPSLDDDLYEIAVPKKPRLTSPRPSKNAVVSDTVRVAAESEPAQGSAPQIEEISQIPDEIQPGEHKKVASTRSAIRKTQSLDRSSIGGRGKFRLLVAPASGERACAILDRLVAAVEVEGWSVESTEQGHAVVADGETIGFMIEEKLDRVPHVITAAEFKEKANYDRKCALADRGIGHRPWRAPLVPEHDYVPNGELVLKFDHDYAMGGIRRSFSDGKRQRLEDLVTLVIVSLARCAAAIRARREEQERWKREWAEREERRKDVERQVRVEGYRIKFLQHQIERKREIDGLADLISEWEEQEVADSGFCELLKFARLYQKLLAAKIAPSAIAERIAKIKLMDDDVYIHDEKRLD
jgi:hypothetical protein